MSKIEEHNLPVAGQLKQAIIEIVYQNRLLGRNPISTDSLYQKIKDFFGLSDEQMELKYSYGGRVVADNIRAAYQQLKDEGILEAPNDGELDFAETAFRQYNEVKKIANKK